MLKSAGGEPGSIDTWLLDTKRAPIGGGLLLEVSINM
jgi:hypothetical protein